MQCAISKWRAYLFFLHQDEWSRHVSWVKFFCSSDSSFSIKSSRNLSSSITNCFLDSCNSCRYSSDKDSHSTSLVFFSDLTENFFSFLIESNTYSWFSKVCICFCKIEVCSVKWSSIISLCNFPACSIVDEKFFKYIILIFNISFKYTED